MQQATVQATVPSRTSSEFPCYARTVRGLMPGTNLGHDEAGRIMVRSEKGIVYNFSNEADVLSEEDGRALIEAGRLARVCNSYSFTELTSEPAPRAVLVAHPTDPARSYLVTQGMGGLLCTCGAFAKSEFHACKHVDAVMFMDAKEGEAARLAPVVKYEALEACRVAREKAGAPIPAPIQPIAREDW